MLSAMKCSFLALLLTTLAHAGETLHVLVLEIDPRFAKPTYERAVGRDRDGLSDAIGKMAKLTPEQGVREWLRAEIERDDPTKRIQTDRMEYTEVDGLEKRVEVGYDHQWMREHGPSRTLKFSAPIDGGQLLRFSCSFRHRLDDQWSLSAAMRGPKGILFVFERLSEKDRGMAPSSWFVSSLLDKKVRGSFKVTPLERLLGNPPGRTAMVRMPDLGKAGRAYAGLDLATPSEIYAGSSHRRNQVRFSVFAPRLNDDLEPVTPWATGVEMDVIHDSKATSMVTHSGEGQMPIEAQPTREEFEMLRRDVERKGTTTTSTPAKKKVPYFLETFRVPELEE